MKGVWFRNFHHSILIFHYSILKFCGPHLNDACLVLFILFFLSSQFSWLITIKSELELWKLKTTFRNFQKLKTELWDMRYGLWVMSYEWWLNQTCPNWEANDPTIWKVRSKIQISEFKSVKFKDSQILGMYFAI